MNKSLFATILLFAISFLSYSQSIDSLKQRHAIAGQWKLVQYKDFATNRVVNEPANLKGSVTVRFEDDGYQGHIEGHTLRNYFNAQYYIRKNNVIYFPSTGGMFSDLEEKEWGDNLPDAFLEASSYIFQKDTLIVKYANDSKAMIFIKTYEATH